MNRFYFLCLTAFFVFTKTSAQLSSNQDKFLGNITTSYNVDYGSEKFYQLWNQITPENESKWDQIEGSSRGSFNWTNCDRAFNYAKQHNFPFKFHTLIWGSQYPRWMDNLSTAEQYKAIVEWMDAIKNHYPNLQLIDVVNEAVAGHAPAPYRAALGGEGKTGYDWIIKAFEMAHERWPDAILIYNDYNTFQWNRQQFIDLVKVLRDAGAPIDAYGCQSHDLTDYSKSTFKSAMAEIQNSLKIPMYITEYDIGTSDDNLQLQRFKEQLPLMWEADYCAGVTLWGYIYGKTWTTDGNSGLIKDGNDRPAMTWLREYMATDAAKNAKSPFPGMVKEASVYVKPSAISVTKGDTMSITVRARLKTKTIDHVDLYVKNKLYTTLTEAPYTVDYVPTALGKYALKAVVVADDSTKYERLSNFTAYNPRAPYKGEIELPGTLQAENFDTGADGISYHDSDTKDEGGTSYRTNGGGVDIVSGNSGYVIGYTAAGEWLEYTVNVKEAGLYSFDASISSQDGGGSFSLSLSNNDGLASISESVSVPKTGSWNTYKVIHGRLTVPLEEGKQILRLNIENAGFNIDKLVFRQIEVDEKMRVVVSTTPAKGIVGDTTMIKVTAQTSTSTIDNVKVYIDAILQKTLTEAPYEMVYKPTAKGTVVITAIATNAEGKQSKIAKKTLTVNNKRIPYKGLIAIPGTIEAEGFDKGGEGLTFHDSDATDEGKANYRTDNEGLDIVTGNSGYVVGYTAANEWMEYSINVTEPGKYAYEAIVSSGNNNSSFTLSLSNNGTQQSLGRVAVPNLGSWDTYTTVKGNLTRTLEAGNHILRITITGAYCNIDKIKLICTESAGVEQVECERLTGNGKTFNLSGQQVGADYKGIIIRNGKKILNR